MVPDPLGSPFRRRRCDRRIRRFTTRWIRFDGPCGDEEGCSPSRVFVVPFRARDPTTLSRSTHDFVSDASSPPGSRLRLRRSARVMSVGSRPLPPPLVKETACHDPRRLRPALALLRSEKLPARVLRRARVVPPLLAPRDGLRLAGDRELRNPDSATLKLTRGHEPFVELAVLPPRRTVVRCASGGRALSSDPPGKATSICVAVRDVPRGTPRSTSLRVPVAFRGRAGSLEPVRPCQGAKCPPAFAGALRTTSEPATLFSGAERFVLRLAVRPRKTS